MAGRRLVIVVQIPVKLPLGIPPAFRRGVRPAANLSNDEASPRVYADGRPALHPSGRRNADRWHGRGFRPAAYSEPGPGPAASRAGGADPESIYGVRPADPGTRETAPGWLQTGDFPDRPLLREAGGIVGHRPANVHLLHPASAEPAVDRQLGAVRRKS